MLRDHLLPANKFQSEIRRRLATDETTTVALSKQSGLEEDGWTAMKPGKRTVRMRKEKRHDVAFEDRVWAMFAKLDFPQLNSGRFMKIRYGDSPGHQKQIDVFAADAEVVLVVECKSATQPVKTTFKNEIEAIKGIRPGIIKTIKQEFPHHKIKFILASDNYVLTKDSKDRIEESDITFMDEDIVDYYLELANHLGKAARYQLLGNLLAGTKIPELDNKVAAIRSKMGGHTYYSFSIEPERLLKMSYVLHRNRANSRLMPTYQRLIKKTRLKSVAQFIANGGFFPNSIIVSIDSKKSLQFDIASTETDGSRVGLLHLPQTYRAAYVIDGQHRLYGYAGSEQAKKELIPVVAFVNLDRSDQVKLFMQINENQQAVPKNLRNTLEGDMLWGSSDLTERKRAIMSRIAQYLGEEKASPLYGRIIVGENKRTMLRCITIQAIRTGLSRGSFLGEFTKNTVKRPGTFYMQDSEETFDHLTDFLDLCFAHTREQLDSQWIVGSGEGGFVFINNGIESLIRVFSDIVDHCVEHDDIDPRLNNIQDVFDACLFYIDPLLDRLEALSLEDASKYRKMYGSGAGTRYWRDLQDFIHQARSDFEPPGLLDYLEAASRRFDNESREHVGEIEQFIKTDVRQRLTAEYGEEGDAWFKQGVPKKLVVEAGKLAVERNADLAPGQPELRAWDCIYLIDYKDIFQQNHGLWQKRFQERYADPEKTSGSWKNQFSWLVQLNEIRNDAVHGRSVTKEQYDYLLWVKSWLVDQDE